TKIDAQELGRIEQFKRIAQTMNQGDRQRSIKIILESVDNVGQSQVFLSKSAAVTWTKIVAVAAAVLERNPVSVVWRYLRGPFVQRLLSLLQSLCGPVDRL